MITGPHCRALQGLRKGLELTGILFRCMYRYLDLAILQDGIEVYEFERESERERTLFSGEREFIT